MTEDKKAAMAVGRAQYDTVSRYLRALEQNKKKPKRSAEQIEQKLSGISAESLVTEDPVKRLFLTQAKFELEDELAASQTHSDFPALEAAFIEVAKPFSERKKVSRNAWISSGVSAEVLKEAGLS